MHVYKYRAGKPLYTYTICHPFLFLCFYTARNEWKNLTEQLARLRDIYNRLLECEIHKLIFTSYVDRSNMKPIQFFFIFCWNTPRNIQPRDENFGLKIMSTTPLLLNLSLSPSPISTIYKYNKRILWMILKETLNGLITGKRISTLRPQHLNTKINFDRFCRPWLLQ